MTHLMMYTADIKRLQVKRSMVSDARYDAVGSSSLRAELFQRHVTGLQDKNSAPETKEQAAERRARERKERAEASVRERQQQVQVDKRRLEHDMQRSRQGAGKEDGEREFGSLLVQAVREHNVRSNAPIHQGRES
jgi:transcription elongation regulator 1